MTDKSFDVDFTKISSLSALKATPINNIWGPDEDRWFSGSNGLLLMGHASNGYTATGIEQPSNANSDGEGYGTFSFTGAAAQAGQGTGICFVMWRADNVWLDASKPGMLTELDILESWDNTTNIQATDHYYNTSSNQNGQIFHTVSNMNITAFHTYNMVWAPGSLTYSIDGKQIYQITGAAVPKDTAHGGNNYVLGAEVVTETGPVGLYVRDMSYTVPGGVVPVGGSVSNPGTGVTPPVVVVPPVVVPPVVVPPVVTPPVVVPPVVTPPVTPPVVVPPTGTHSLTVTSLTENSGKLLLTGDKEIGSNATMREFMDGKYLGTLTDGLKDGKFSMTIADVATGSHTLALTLDGSSVGASYAFAKAASGAITVGTTVNPPVVVPPVVTAPLPPVITPPIVVPPVMVPPITTPTPTMSFVISAIAENSGHLVISGTKYTGASNTVREFIDNSYKGVVQDHRADGTFALNVADVSTGAHSLTLTLDGSNLSATYGFTKSASGTVTALTAAATKTNVVTPVLTHT